MLESLIRQLIHDLVDPVSTDNGVMMNDMREIRSDHNLLSQRLSEYDKRMH